MFTCLFKYNYLSQNENKQCCIYISLKSQFFKIISWNFLSCSNIPDNYKVLFLQGGGTGQFSAVPLNLAKGRATFL